ncbi:MAG: NrdJb [Oleispira sp.]|nr:NrdJb [Oleispira sp.]
MLKIEKKITAYEVVDLTADKQETEDAVDIEQMHESLKRPEMLLGSTYKIKPPMAEHALYVTINDVVLNPDTDYELRRPFEMFINSKNMDQFQWIVALTRVASAVFRKGGDVTFLVEEFKAVFDPHGGYLKKGGIYMPSLVAEIGHALEKHLIMIGLLKPAKIPAHQQKILDEKRAQFDSASSIAKELDTGFPTEAKICKKCHTKASILMDGCLTCLNCGDSKCG